VHHPGPAGPERAFLVAWIAGFSGKNVIAPDVSMRDWRCNRRDLGRRQALFRVLFSESEYNSMS
ncbi:MAG: hypothetical protein KAH44_06540, partial [Oricola sp.]|nr:hypothetical protein [Oricola sp.]